MLWTAASFFGRQKRKRRDKIDISKTGLNRWLEKKQSDVEATTFDRQKKEKEK